MVTGFVLVVAGSSVVVGGGISAGGCVYVCVNYYDYRTLHDKMYIILHVFEMVKYDCLKLQTGIDQSIIRLYNTCTVIDKRLNA